TSTKSIFTCLGSKKFADCPQWLDVITDDLENRQQRDRHQRSRHAPKPSPKDKPQEDDDRIQQEPTAQDPRRHQVFFQQVQTDIRYLSKVYKGKKTVEKVTIFSRRSSVKRASIETTLAPTPAPKKEIKGSSPAMTPHKSGVGKPSRYMLPPTAAPKAALIQL